MKGRDPFEDLISTLLWEGIEKGVFPAGAAGVSIGAPAIRKKYSMEAGHSSLYPARREMTHDTLFDLASLTKPLGTVLAMLCLLKEKKLRLDAPLGALLRNHPLPRDKEQISLWHLLSHSAGFPAYRPFYLDLVHHPLAQRKAKLQELVLTGPLEYEPGTRSLYSDLGFMILGWIIEKTAGLPLDVFIRKNVLDPVGLGDRIIYQPALNDPKKQIPVAATEDCPWRKRILCGEVHDENTFAMGGVSGQAGLFGDIESVLRLTALVFDIWKGRGKHPLIEAGDLAAFLARQEGIPKNTWAFGFDTVSPNNSSAGRFFCRRSAGHLGYTGTSFWMEPDLDLVVVLLTNRVHPTRENIKIREFRPFFHDALYQGAVKYHPLKARS